MPDGRKGIQDQVTGIGQEAQAFHDGPLLWMCALISLFVLGLLGYTMVKFRRGANPKPVAHLAQYHARKSPGPWSRC